MFAIRSSSFSMNSPLNFSKLSRDLSRGAFFGEFVASIGRTSCVPSVPGASLIFTSKISVSQRSDHCADQLPVAAIVTQQGAN